MHYDPLRRKCFQVEFFIIVLIFPKIIACDFCKDFFDSAKNRTQDFAHARQAPTTGLHPQP